MLNEIQKQQHADFNTAKQIALNIAKGLSRRAISVNGGASNYTGCKLNDGRMFVIGDSEKDLQNPNAYIESKPAREIFGEFTGMFA